MSLTKHERSRFGLMLAVSAILSSTASAQVLVGPGTTTPIAAPATAGGVQHAQIRTAQRGRAGTSSSAKPLPYEIVATPDVEEDLEVIERRSQLMITRDKVVRTAIADSRIIDVVQYSPTEIAVIGLDRGTTTLTLWFEGSKDPLIYLVKVIPDPSLEEQRQIDYGKLERKLAKMFPNSKVYLVPLTRRVVVMGQARDGEEAARILEIVQSEVIGEFGNYLGQNAAIAAGGGVGGIGGAGLGGNGINNGFNNGFGFGNGFIVNMLEVPGDFQVQLRVRIAELNRQQLRRMGVDWDVLFGDGAHFIGSALGGGAGTLTGIFEAGEINVLINWLASNGTAKILSEPVMTVLSGHSASFLSGGEFAVPTIVGIGGAQGQQTSFRGFGTSLLATPTIIDRDLIRMRIVPEFSAINPGNAVGGIPGVDSRRVQTTVQLREGQTLAIAGLIGRQQSTEVTRIPFLGAIPWIGPAVFNTKRATEDETELLILVSPEIVRPMEADEVPPVPGFNVTHPNDCELYWHARTEGAPDLQYYQLAPFGRGAGHGIPVGYKLFEPAPASPSYPPAASGAYAGSSPYPISPGGGTMVAAPMQSFPTQPYTTQPYPIESHPHPYGPGSSVPHGSRYAPPRDAVAPPSQPVPQPLPPQPIPRGTLPAPSGPGMPALNGPSARRPGGVRTSQVEPGNFGRYGYPQQGRVAPAGFQSNVNSQPAVGQPYQRGYSR